MAKYKVGDKVRVRSDLILGRRYLMEDKETGDVFVVPMDNLLGKVVTIKVITRKYLIEEMAFNWTDEMFEGLVEELKFNVYDTVKHEKYGIGTVIDMTKHLTRKGKRMLKVEFDNWHDDFPNYDETAIWVESNTLRVIQSYLPN